MCAARAGLAARTEKCEICYRFEGETGKNIVALATQEDTLIATATISFKLEPEEKF
jgi:hypothetical protein